MPRRVPDWRPLVAPAALSAFVAGLGVLPYLEFARQEGSLEAFKSAFDEDTYLLGDTSTPYRFLSDAALDLIDLVTPGGVTGVLLATDIVLPILVVIAAWLLVTRVVEDTGLRILSVLLLLFGQEFFSLANSIVWDQRVIVDLRELAPPTTLMLFPDATTSYFSLFRTPEPAVSWALLFGFLALVSNRDPIAAFEGRRRLLTYPVSALLGFAYPFSSIPIVLIMAVLLAWSFLYDRSRSRAVGVALLIAATSFLLALLISAIGDSASGASVAFSSRTPVLTPALAVGTLVFVSFFLIHRGDVLRRPEILIPATAALLPVAIANQQIVTGMMTSARDWERYTNYPLVIFALISLIAGLKRRWSPEESKQLAHLLRLGAWIAVVLLGVQLVGWQRGVYRAWLSTNVEAHTIADLLQSLSGRITEYPVVLENAGLVPLVRLLTDDQQSYVLDYTRLFEKPVPTFAAGTPTNQAALHRDELFAYAFRLGWSPARLDTQIRSELNGEGGFYAHFVFAVADVWSPATDGRRLRVDEALRRLPSVTAAYSEYLHKQADNDPGPVLVVTSRTPDYPGDGRTNELVASASPSSGSTAKPSIYVQMSDR